MALRRVLQTIERALARQRLAVRPQHRIQLPGQHTEGRVLAQLVVIVEVLVAQHQAKDPLPDQRLDPVLDVARIATVGEAFARTDGSAPDRDPPVPAAAPPRSR